MLRPIVEAAGYRVIGDDDEGDADLVIAAQGEKVDAANADLPAQRARTQEQERREHLPV